MVKCSVRNGLLVSVGGAQGGHSSGCWGRRGACGREEGEHTSLVLLDSILAGHAFGFALLATHCRGVCMAQAIECAAVGTDEAELAAVAAPRTRMVHWQTCHARL